MTCHAGCLAVSFESFLSQTEMHAGVSKGLKGGSDEGNRQARERLQAGQLAESNEGKKYSMQSQDEERL
jgi:hypothetical protein